MYFCKRNHKNLHYANKFPNQTIVPRSNEGELGIGDPALRRILRTLCPLRHPQQRRSHCRSCGPAPDLRLSAHQLRASANIPRIRPRQAPPDHRRTVLRIQQYLLLESHRNGPVIWNLHVPLDVAAHRPRHHQGTVVCNGAVHRIRQSGNRLRRGDRTQYGNDARTQDAIISHAARHDRLVASQPAHARYRYAVDSPLLPNCLREFLP